LAGGTNSTQISGNVGSFPTLTVVAGDSRVFLLGTDYLQSNVSELAKGDLAGISTAAHGKGPRILIAGDIGGLTLTEGVYFSSSTIGITGDLTLSGLGNPDAVFLFIAESALLISGGARVVLTGSAQACNVFWVLGSSGTIGVNSEFVGTIVAYASATVMSGARVTGRILVGSAITLDSNMISLPACASSSVTATGCSPYYPDFLLAGPTAGSSATLSAFFTITTASIFVIAH